MITEQSRAAASLAVRRPYGVRWIVVLGAMVFVLIGAAVIGIGINKAAKEIAFLRNAVMTTGTVIKAGTPVQHTDAKFASSSEDSARSNESVIPNVSFEMIGFDVQDGHIEKFKHHHSPLEGSLVKGDKVSVVYDPRQPANARVGRFVSLWGVPIAVVMLGLIFAASGIAMYALLGRSGRPREISDSMQTLIFSLLESGRQLAAIQLVSKESGMDIAEAAFYLEGLKRKYYGGERTRCRESSEISA